MAKIVKRSTKDIRSIWLERFDFAAMLLANELQHDPKEKIELTHIHSLRRPLFLQQA